MSDIDKFAEIQVQINAELMEQIRILNERITKLEKLINK